MENESKTKLIRTTVMVTEETHRELLSLSEKAKRPLSWEVRLALESYVATQKAAA